MKWGVLLAVSLASLAAAATLGWIGVRQEREFRRLVAEGDAALASGRPVDAIEAFSGALALKPQAMLPYLKRGDAYRRRGEHAAALRDLSHAVRLDPTAVRAIELLGDVNLAAGRPEAAVAHYERFLGIDDRAPRILYKLALAQYRLGRPDQALDPLRRAIQLEARFTEAHYLLGLALRERQRHGEAVRAFARSLELDPAFIPAREALATLYRTLNRPTERLEQLEALAAIEPGRPERLVTLACAYAETGRFDAALLVLGRAGARHPDAAVVQVALARLWLDTVGRGGDRRQALGRARRAVERLARQPDAAGETLALYGRVLLLGDELRDAERVLVQATRRLPVRPEALQDLAQAAQRLGHGAIASAARARYHAVTSAP